MKIQVIKRKIKKKFIKQVILYFDKDEKDLKYKLDYKLINKIFK